MFLRLLTNHPVSLRQKSRKLSVDLWRRNLKNFPSLRVKQHLESGPPETGAERPGLT